PDAPTCPHPVLPPQAGGGTRKLERGASSRRTRGKGTRRRVHALFLRVRDRAFREEARLRPSFAPATPRLRRPSSARAQFGEGLVVLAVRLVRRFLCAGAGSVVRFLRRIPIGHGQQRLAVLFLEGQRRDRSISAA